MAEGGKDRKEGGQRAPDTKCVFVRQPRTMSTAVMSNTSMFECGEHLFKVRLLLWFISTDVLTLILV